MKRNKSGRWQITGSTAVIAKAGTEFQMNVAEPAAGVQVTIAGGQLAQIFQTEQLSVPENESLDPYVRGNDLIVTYPSSDSRRVGAELFWRCAEFTGAEPIDESADESPDVAVLELIYSLQTQFLDTQPDPEIQSLVSGRSLRVIGCDENNVFQIYESKEGDGQWVDTDGQAGSLSHGCLIDCGDSQMVIAVIPSDLRGLKIASADSESADNPNLDDLQVFKICCQLNSDFLEKGVIRRLRLFGAVGGSDSELLLLAAANDFLNSKIPLTA